MKKCISILLASVMLLAAFGVSISAQGVTVPTTNMKGTVEGDTNVAEGKTPVTNYAHRSYPIKWLTDGIRNESDPAGGNQRSLVYGAKRNDTGAASNYPAHYVYVDLGKPYRIHSMALSERVMTANIKRLYDIEVYYRMEEPDMSGVSSNGQGGAEAAAALDQELENTWELGAKYVTDDAYRSGEAATKTYGTVTIDNFEWFTARYVLLRMPEAGGDGSVHTTEWEIYGAEPAVEISTTRADTTIDNSAKTISVNAESTVAANDFLQDITVADALQQPGETVEMTVVDASDNDVTGNLATGQKLQLKAGETVTAAYTLTVAENTPKTNASVSPVAASYDKYTSHANHKDIAVTLTAGDYTFSALKNGETTLTENTDYTVSGNTYTIKTSYLDTLVNGEQTLTFEMDGGTNPTVVVTVADSTPTVPVDPTDKFGTGAVEGDANLALNKKAATKGPVRNSYRGRGSKNLTDGTTNTRSYVEVGGYIFVDLGDTYRIHSSVIRERNNINKGGNDRNRLKKFNLRYCTELPEDYAIKDDTIADSYTSDMATDYITETTWPLVISKENDETYRASETDEIVTVDDFKWFTARYVMLQITEGWQKSATDFSLDLYEWEIYGAEAETNITTNRADTKIDNSNHTISIVAQNAITAGSFLQDITVIDALQQPGETVQKKIVNNGIEVTDSNLVTGMELQLVAVNPETGTSRVTARYSITFQDVGNDISISSKTGKYVIDETAETVTVRTASEVSYAEFTGELDVPNASYQILNGAEEVASGNITDGMRLKLTSQNGNVTKTYTIRIQTISTDATLSSELYAVDSVGNRITARVSAAPSVAEFRNNLTAAAGAAITVLNGTAEVTSGAIADGMKVKVTAEDGATTKEYTVSLTVLVNITKDLEDAAYTESSAYVDKGDGLPRSAKNIFQEDTASDKKGWSPTASGSGWAKVDLGSVQEVDMFNVKNGDGRLAGYEIRYSKADFSNPEDGTLAVKGSFKAGGAAENIHYLDAPVRARYLMINITDAEGGLPRVNHFWAYLRGGVSISSADYVVDLEEAIISDISLADAANSATILSKLTPAEGAALRIVDASGNEVTGGAVTNGCKAEVTAYGTRFVKNYELKLGFLPKAENVTVTENGGILTGGYTYINPDVAEGTSEFSWYESFEENSGYQLISGATGKTYTVKDTDGGKFIKFAVAPVDMNGLKGQRIESANAYSVPKAEGTDELLAAVRAYKPFGTEKIDGDIQLDGTLPGGITIEWTSSDPATVEIDGTTGKVTRPLNAEEDKTVRLHAVFTLGDAKTAWDYEITVKKCLPDAEAVQADVDALRAYMQEILKNALTQDIELPVKGFEGSTITWTTSNAAAVTADGKVTRPAAGANATAVLTAVISVGSAKQSARFSAEVASLNPGNTGSGNSGSSGGGGGRGPSGSNSGTSFSQQGGTNGNPNGQPNDNANPQKPAWENAYFKDLDQVAWAKDAVYYLLYRDVLSPAESFEPQRTVTREEFVKMIVMAFGYYDESAEADLRDTTPGMWHYSYIASAMNSGIVSGITAKQFGVGQEITRQDMALILYRVCQKKKISLGQDTPAEAFDDAYEIAPYAMEAVSALRGAGMVGGVGGNRFAPENSATRAEAAKMIYEAMQR